MSLSRHLFRQPTSKAVILRHYCAAPASESPASHRNHHDYLPPSSYINSWKPSQNPKVAAAQLAFLRLDYDRKVKQMRKQYIGEMELQRIEKLRKDEARKEALRIANEERRAAKDAKKKAEAIERQAAEEEFRQMLVKERAEKLEYWRMREKQVEEKKKEKNEVLRRQSSLWIDEDKLVTKALEITTVGADSFRMPNY
ncbi:hypothetical protein BUALT_Bualt09G0016400 [Buddleja alternifolia]|uniref:Uncharacterized protein n=1 Tax=Buddleja alternifolia TaxID=168488 RepID=A0AAV6WZ62_9LAMI|nr:hypothetical protein BUALT_Bualt09G0016400 [Buddleja alternifolia]